MANEYLIMLFLVLVGFLGGMVTMGVVQMSVDIQKYETQLESKTYLDNGVVLLYFHEGDSTLEVYTTEKVADNLMVGGVYKIYVVHKAASTYVLIDYEEVGGNGES